MAVSVVYNPCCCLPPATCCISVSSSRTPRCTNGISQALRHAVVHLLPAQCQPNYIHQAAKHVMFVMPCCMSQARLAAQNDSAKPVESYSKSWEMFHSQHSSARFYKERRYLPLAFPQLVQGAPQLHIVELGCGTGAALMPLLKVLRTYSMPCIALCCVQFLDSAWCSWNMPASGTLL